MVLVGEILVGTGEVLVPESEANLEVDFDSEISVETDVLIPREPDGVFPVAVTAAVTMGAMEWAVLRSEIPVFWMMEEDGIILVWVGNILELV